jgi:hypothetical protein
MIDMDMQLYHTDLRIAEAERAVESQKLHIGSLAWDGHETVDAERTLRDLRAQLFQLRSTRSALLRAVEPAVAAC